MLYYRKSKMALLKRSLRSIIAVVVAGLGNLHKARQDRVYLDGLRRSELEDLGLRRADDGSYRTFRD
jgi:uncharacterized protein YjiS (DUF1127 family)